MKIEISKQINVVETIDVELPYYFTHDLSGDYDTNTIYGKIEKDEHTKIHLYYSGEDLDEVIIEKKTHNLTQNHNICDYFQEYHKSTKVEYDWAMKEAKEFINNLK